MTHRMRLDEPIFCRIRIQGSLAQHWSEYLGGLSISVTGEPGHTETTLSGDILDQAALMGVLNGLYGMGYPLLVVECQSIQQEATEGRNEQA